MADTSKVTLSEAGLGLLLVDSTIRANEKTIRELTAAKDELLAMIEMLHRSNAVLAARTASVCSILSKG